MASHSYDTNITLPSLHKHTSVAFQGSRGSFSEQAVEQCFGTSVSRKAFHTFEQVFTAISEKTCTYAVIPIENTLIGTVFDSFDNFLRFTDVRAIADITLRIVHNLIGLPHTAIRDITTVYSQLPGIGQCQEYLNRHKHWTVVPFRDTAAAVQYVAKENKPYNAAIASKKAAEIYNLKILKEGIESHSHNYTRFAIITHKETASYTVSRTQEKQRYAGLVIFSVKDETGSLLHCLEIFAQYDINLHKIESRPIIGKPWAYQFVVELDYTISHKTLQCCLQKIQKLVVSFHIIGTFLKTDTSLLHFSFS